MDTVIIYYFDIHDKKKLQEFHDDIIKNLTISTKIKIFKTVLSHIQQEQKINYCKDLISIIEEIFSLRNQIAHWNWTSVFPNEVKLIKEHLKTEKIITDKELDQFVNSCKKAISKMTTLLRDIGYCDKLIKSRN